VPGRRGTVPLRRSPRESRGRRTLHEALWHRSSASVTASALSPDASTPRLTTAWSGSVSTSPLALTVISPSASVVPESDSGAVSEFDPGSSSGSVPASPLLSGLPAQPAIAVVSPILEAARNCRRSIGDRPPETRINPSPSSNGPLSLERLRRDPKTFGELAVGWPGSTDPMDGTAEPTADIDAVETVADLIGETPLLRLESVADNCVGKLEAANPTRSRIGSLEQSSMPPSERARSSPAAPSSNRQAATRGSGWRRFRPRAGMTAC